MAEKNTIQVVADQAVDAAAAAGQTLVDRTDDVKQQLATTAQNMADRTSASRAEAGAVATASMDKASEVTALMAQRAREVTQTVADRMPNSAEQWQEAGRDLAGRVRANPGPWALGAAAVVVVWWLGRRSAQTS
ncbi:hypothetical protein [Catellatospora vulcania]|uniref:hypothetical protein n=1 Tax=Catellatospora vulcania TaxID=1460450 RepID=UPI0012D3A1DB|nr:hypothetical protein [Catellatospora vulcania]